LEVVLVVLVQVHRHCQAVQAVVAAVKKHLAGQELPYKATLVVVDLLIMQHMIMVVVVVALVQLVQMLRQE
jgi:hypothetical protein